MPELETENKPEGFQDPAANNADVKQKLEAQTIDKLQSDPTGTNDALDALAKAVVEKKDEEPVVETPPAPVVDDEAVRKAADEAAAKAAERTATLKKSDEYFKDLPSLPPGASSKSGEAFAAVKIKAAQEISARESQLEETRKKLAEAEEKLKAGPDPEVLKELEDHRAWRAKLDVDADPRFKEFDKQVSSSQEFIYAQLRKNPTFTPEVIDQIKKHGGPENVKLDKLFATANDSTLQRIVERKVDEIEMAKFNKEQAVKAAKDNIHDYVAQQHKVYAEGATAHNKATQDHFSQLKSKLTWFADKPVDPKADEPTRKSAEAHNALVSDIRKNLDTAMTDDSAEMRAVMLAGMAQLLYLQNVRAGEKTQLEALTKELTETKAKLDKFVHASGSRIRETSAPPGGKLDTKSKGIDFDKRAGDALDDIAKQVMEERARKASA